MYAALPFVALVEHNRLFYFYVTIQMSCSNVQEWLIVHKKAFLIMLLSFDEIE
ncbi:MAG: hypothetical protein HRT87_05935 [Legionellales bacterium]|nr:hypothetical protein [Legionellales bacterium]